MESHADHVVSDAMLEGFAPEALAALVARCPECAVLLDRLQHVDRELRAAAFVAPPPGLQAAVMRRLAAEAALAAPRPLVRGIVLDAGVIATGIALACAALILAVTSPAGAFVVDQVRLILLGAALLVTGLVRVDVPLFWPLQAAIAAAVALAWFAVLVLPRQSATAIPIPTAR